MSLESAIKQTRPFNFEAEKCIVNIIYTNNWINIFQNKIVKDFGISLEQYNVMRILNGQKGSPITINGIIDRMLDKMSNASRLVDKLYLKGLVERKQMENNRRACDVTLTLKGEETLRAISLAFDEKIFKKFSLSEEEYAKLNEQLDIFRESFEGN
jgi:DNA-binding MarR family transcriptional regulator